MQDIKSFAAAINFLKIPGTRACVAMGCEGFMVFINKRDLIDQLSGLDRESKPGHSHRFSDYDGNAAEGSVWIKNNVLHFDSSVVIPKG